MPKRLLLSDKYRALRAAVQALIMRGGLDLMQVGRRNVDLDRNPALEVMAAGWHCRLKGASSRSSVSGRRL